MAWLLGPVCAQQSFSVQRWVVTGVSSERREGGFGRDDIWRARQGSDGHWTVENAGSELNTPDDESEFQPSADGKWGSYRLIKAWFA
jgi:hypothetical protein